MELASGSHMVPGQRRICMHALDIVSSTTTSRSSDGDGAEEFDQLVHHRR